MKTQTWRLLAILALAVGLGIAGCSSDHPTAPSASQPADNYANIDLNKTFGGLTATNDPPPQTDPVFAAALAEDAAEAANDPLASDPLVERLEMAGSQPQMPGGPARPRFTFLRIVWGALSHPDTLGVADQPEVTDWSGTLQVDRGVVVVRRVISFERPGDHLVFPRPDIRTVGWDSHTGGDDVDGLLVEIIEPPMLASQADSLPPNMLRFTTAPFAQSFAVADLAGLDQTFTAGPAGDAIRFSGFGLTPLPACPEGFLAGLWVARSDSAGVFKGRWIGVRGELTGFLRGAWGFDSSGQRVLVGKWISRTGAFRGLLHGTWEPGAQPGGGSFNGQWVNAAMTAEGVFSGDYMRAPMARVGLFSGLWATSCDAQAAGQVR